MFKFRPSNKHAGYNLGNYCYTNKIWLTCCSPQLWDSHWVRLLSPYFSKLNCETWSVSTVAKHPSLHTVHGRILNSSDHNPSIMGEPIQECGPPRRNRHQPCFIEWAYVTQALGVTMWKDPWGTGGKNLIKFTARKKNCLVCRLFLSVCVVSLF